MEPKDIQSFDEADLHFFCAKLSDAVFDRKGVRAEFRWTEMPDGGILVYNHTNIAYTMYPHVGQWIVTELQ